MNENYEQIGSGEEEKKGDKMFGLSVTLLFAIGSLIFCIPAIVLLVLGRAERKRGRPKKPQQESLFPQGTG